jgi:hypothetical protein
LQQTDERDMREQDFASLLQGLVEILLT